MALTGAVRKGGLLRGKVPQGETSPLKLCVEGLRSDPEVKKNVSYDVRHSVFFWQSVFGWSDTPLRCRAEPCRGALC